MDFILIILFIIIFVIFLIAVLLYFSINKYLVKKYKKDKLENVNNAFTYSNIIKGLGTLENVNKVEKDIIYVISINLVNIKYLNKLGLKVLIEEPKVFLTIKGFNLNNFFKRLDRDLKK